MFKLLAENILYSDNHILAVNKKAGQLVQGDKTRDYTLLDASKAYIKQEYNKPGNVYLGLVHRLDRTVNGIIVFARTSKAAARLSKQIKEKQFKKTYIACVGGEIQQNGRMTDYIKRIGSSSRVTDDADSGQYAELFYNRLAVKKGVSLVEIDLKTGRHHQIRIQFAARGHSIIGDRRYGSTAAFKKGAIALCASKVEFQHPTRDERIILTVPVEHYWKKYMYFEEKIWRNL